MVVFASAFDHPLPLDLQKTLRDGLVKIEPVPSAGIYTEETPVEGRGAISRWLALHDRAKELGKVLRPGDDVRGRQGRRAVCSLFLYEHQLTAATRRKAREALWRRDRTDTLPDFATRARWSRCRCGRCQRAVSSL